MMARNRQEKNPKREGQVFSAACQSVIKMVATRRRKKISISSQGWYVTSSLPNQFKALFRHSALEHSSPAQEDVQVFAV